MVVIRCTGRVLSQIKVKALSEPLPGHTKLGDWYVNLLYLRPRRLLLCVAERTLLPIVIPAKEFGSFPERLVTALAEILAHLDIDDALVREELAAMSEVKLARTASRQIVGSLNDFARMLECGYLDNRSLRDVSLHLAETPCGPIGMESPDRATRKLFNREH